MNLFRDGFITGMEQRECRIRPVGMKLPQSLREFGFSPRAFRRGE